MIANENEFQGREGTDLQVVEAECHSATCGNESRSIVGTM